ncbi:dephospho-CoA kinase [Undibacterium cyanobacteriorum]|uniref:Dephospho-CoA kinase n=1 Tax=Undibacterium cyanobacteriorum TaxID=3073561 RepID=A0ABY9RFY3_9BURK|nr:dephospho-CoA kinase [Undibacterium sp. 20NA77.5]WMW80152.1 dephospho-CoA kinase [Undibacterium sp. 20NA77.5]
MNASVAPSFSLGITGGIGSGKTTVANMFETLGATIIDTDLIAHQVTAPQGLAIDAICAAFGKEALDENGALDRKKMRELVFKQPHARRQLEAILHPIIRQECERQALYGAGAYPIFVVPLLYESGTWAERLTQILVVDCEEETQIQRVMSRNGFSRQQVEDILLIQATRAERLSIANDVINSDQDLEEIRLQVADLHQKYLKLAQAA